LTLFFSRPTLEKFQKNRRAISVSASQKPLAALIRELGKRPGLSRVRLQKGALKVEQTF
jgi:hypothetical protein